MFNNIQNLKNINSRIYSLTDKKAQIKEKYRNENILKSYLYYEDKDYIKLEKEIELLSIEKYILQDNILFKMQEIYNEKIEEILLKYKDKAIGEKTKEKIQNEVKAVFKDMNINVSCYLTTGTKNAFFFSDATDKVTIYILSDEGFTDYRFKSFNVTYDYYRENPKTAYFTGIKRIQKLEYIENPREEAKRLKKEHDEAVEKIKTLKNEIDNIREKFNSTLSGERYNYFHISK